MEHDVLGEVIKESRMRKGLSQEQLAEMLNCSPRHIMAIENEHKKTGYKRLYKIIRLLNIPPIRYSTPNAERQQNRTLHLMNL